MKENVFDVLMYLFENYMDEGAEFQPDQEALTHELTQAGFHRGEIRKAFSWLDGLSSLREDNAGKPPKLASVSIRHYTPEEQERLDEDCRGYLHFMEASGVIDPATREVIIDRLLALETDEITLDQIKWVMLLVLCNQPEQEYAYHMLEDMVFDEMQGHLH
jgi:Smg protein